MIFFKAYQKTIAFIFFIWLVTLLFNLTKAVHIDDAAYLEIARYVALHPLHPYSGWLNWFDTVQPMFFHFHPPLIPYLYAAVIYFLGESEIVFHLLISLFTLAAITFFYLLAKYFTPRYAYILTAMFILGPTFLPAQNLMADVPLISLYLGFFWAIATISKQSEISKRYFLAALFISFASLVKYTSLILIPVLILDIILKKRWRFILTALIPFLVIGIWSLFNYLDYGKIHILSIQNNLDILGMKDRFLVLLIALGAMTPFSLIFLPNLLFNKNIFVLLGSIIIAILFSQQYWRFIGEPVINYYLRLYFFANGLLIFGLIMIFVLKKIREIKKINIFILIVWYLVILASVIIFAPFMAIRHLLLVMPVILLMLGIDVFPKINKKTVWLGAFISVFFGLSMAISDWIYADVYRRYAPMIYRKINTIQNKQDTVLTVWFGGHWGWQWYAQKSGMKQYDTWRTVFQNGDYLVMPSVERQYINPQHLPMLKVVDVVRVPSHSLNLIRIMTDFPYAPRGYYALGYLYLPWTISSLPLEEFIIFRVES